MRGEEIIYRDRGRDIGGGLHMRKHSYTKTSMSTHTQLVILRCDKQLLSI